MSKQLILKSFTILGVSVLWIQGSCVVDPGLVCCVVDPGLLHSPQPSRHHTAGLTGTPEGVHTWMNEKPTHSSHTSVIMVAKTFRAEMEFRLTIKDVSSPPPVDNLINP